MIRLEINGGWRASKLQISISNDEILNNFKIN